AGGGALGDADLHGIPARPGVDLAPQPQPAHHDDEHPDHRHPHHDPTHHAAAALLVLGEGLVLLVRLLGDSAHGRASNHDCNSTAAATLSTTRRRASAFMRNSILPRSAVTVVRRSSHSSTGTGNSSARASASAWADWAAAPAWPDIDSGRPTTTRSASVSSTMRAMRA